MALGNGLLLRMLRMVDSRRPGSCCILLGSALQGAQIERLLRQRLEQTSPTSPDLVPRSGLGGAIAEWVLQRTLPKWASNGTGRLPGCKCCKVKSQTLLTLGKCSQFFAYCASSIDVPCSRRRRRDSYLFSSEMAVLGSVWSLGLLRRVETSNWRTYRKALQGC